MANRYWVGGTAAWDGTAGTKWALTSGGAGGQAVPTSADDVFFDAASGAVTCTISTGNIGAKSINCTGFTGTLTGTAAITVSGSVTLVAGMTYSYTSTMTLNGTGTITSAGKTFATVTVNGAGITVTLNGALTQGSNYTFTLTQGTLALAGFTLTCGIFSSSGSNTRAISFGTGGIAITNNNASATVLSMATMTNFSWTGSAGTEGFSYTRTTSVGIGTLSVGSSAGGTVSNAVNMSLRAATNSGATSAITTGSYIKNLTFPVSTPDLTVNSAIYNACGNLDIIDPSVIGTANIAPTFRASGSIRSFNQAIGNTAVNGSGITVTLIGALFLGPTRTFTLTQGTLDLNGSTLSTGFFISNATGVRGITFGSANIELTSTTAATTVLSMGTATNFTWTGTGGFIRNQAATATVAFGVAGGTTANAPNLTVNAGASALTINSGSYFKNVIFTGNASTVTASNLNMAGNLTLASGGTYTAVVPTFRASGTITSAGRTLGNTTINGSGITVTLADALTLDSASILTLTQGTFTAANFNVTAGSFSSNNSNTRTLNMGSGTWTLLSAPPPGAWDTTTTTGLTFNPSTSTISVTSAATKAFNGGGLTYYNLNQGGAGQTNISGSNTFNNITNSTQPATVTFTAGTTQTVSAFGLSGTAGNLITINSLTPGSQFTLSKASGTVNAQYLSLQDSNATGGATWNALLTNGNVDAGNNTGWNFVSSAGGKMFFMFG